MHAAQHPALPGPLLLDGYAGQPLPPDHRRLLGCLAVSALALTIAIWTVNVNLRFDFATLLPAILDVTLYDRPSPPTSEQADDAPRPSEKVPVPATDQPRATDVTPAAPPVAGTADSETVSEPVDWYDTLDRVAADVGERHAIADSLHPEFDELRRIAARRYGKPQTNKASPPWENVEKDIYGRTIMTFGNCFMVLDDDNLGNRYAFETFERNLMQCGISFGKRRPKNLPWVAIIQAKYPHLRDPDGSQSAAGGVPPRTSTPP